MPTAVDKRLAAREIIDILMEIATLLVRLTLFTTGFWTMLSKLHPQNTHLDRQTISLCVSMIENGVNPEALAVGGLRIVTVELQAHCTCTSRR